jgi:hypothetical protein
MRFGDGLVTHDCPLGWLLKYRGKLGAIGATCNADFAPSTGFSANLRESKKAR